MLEIVGVTLNNPELQPTYDDEVSFIPTTVTGPVTAPTGTLAVIVVSETTVKSVDMLPMLTQWAPVKPVPVIVTGVPTGPDEGENAEIVGTTMNDPELVAVPAGVLTATGPSVAPLGTVAVIVVSETTVNWVVIVPLNCVKRTAVAPVKPVPVMVTEAPTGPDEGEIVEIVGAGV
jgi:hypothetical protein